MKNTKNKEVIYKKYELELKVLEENTGYYCTDTSKEVYQFINNAIKPERFPEERLYMICYNCKLIPIGFMEMSKGALDGTIVDIKSIIKFALLSNAAAFTITHNHPSGDPTPSKEDISVTRKVQKAAKTMELNFVDHIICGDNCYISLREMGELEDA